MVRKLVRQGSKQGKRASVTDAKLNIAKLKTEKAGRLFAVEVLERLKKADGDAATIYPYDMNGYDYGEKIVPYRRVGQSDVFFRDIMRLVKYGSYDACKGFASIFTDALACDINIDLSVYRRLEREGKLLPFGTTAAEYPLPEVRTKAQTEAQKKREQRDYESVVTRGEDQKPWKERHIANDEPEQVERFLQATGMTRRAATAFLARPYDEIAQEIKADKKAAEAFAEVAAALEKCNPSYATVMVYLENALRNIRCAVRARKDGEKLLRAARKQHARAQ